MTLHKEGKTPLADRDSPGELSPDDLGELLAHRHRFVVRLAGWLGSANAEDIVQEAYLRALRHGDRIRRHERAVAWFARILHNAAIDHIRHESAEYRARSRYASEATAEPPWLDDTQSKQGNCVNRAMESLRPEQRTRLRRVDLDELNPTEAAQELGITGNNARVRLHRARAALRRRLVDQCGPCAGHRCADCNCPDSARIARPSATEQV